MSAAPLPDPPELPQAARPAWRPWHGFAAFGAGSAAVGGLAFLAVPLLIAVALDALPDGAGAFVTILLQDAAWLGAAVALGRTKAPVRGWQLGLRRAPARRTIAIVLVSTVAMLAFEIGYLELFDTGEGNNEGLASDIGVLAAVAISLTVIVVAPVFEELFFRGFVYRALRNRFRIWSAALIDGACFGVLHFKGFGSIEILPVIAIFGLLLCVVYEVTGTIFAPIAMHAVFNTFAMAGTDAGPVVPIVIGAGVLVACVAIPARLAPSPSAFPTQVRR